MVLKKEYKELVEQKQKIDKRLYEISQIALNNCEFKLGESVEYVEVFHGNVEFEGKGFIRDISVNNDCEFSYLIKDKNGSHLYNMFVDKVPTEEPNSLQYFLIKKYKTNGN